MQQEPEPAIRRLKTARDHFVSRTSAQLWNVGNREVLRGMCIFDLIKDTRPMVTVRSFLGQTQRNVKAFPWSKYGVDCEHRKYR